MATYRCYILDSEDRISSVHSVEAEDDADALNEAAIEIRVSLQRIQ